MNAAPTEMKPARERPRDRRIQIARNAGELFSARGFHAVRMDDIARASGITARALYRHYENKQALLSHVLIEDQAHVVDTLTALAAQPDEVRDVVQSLEALASAALDSRRLSLLWQREARHLSAEDFHKVRTRTRWIARQIEELLVRTDQVERDAAAAEIRSWAIVSIVSGPAFYECALSKKRLTEELVAASGRVLAHPEAPPEPSDIPPRTRTSGSRREQLVQAAGRTFRSKGFAGVSIDDIGAEVGIAGPALYRYFDTKADILVAVVTRLHEWQALEAARAMNTPGADEAVIVELVRGYIRVALGATDLLAVSLTEWLYLPEGVIDRLERIRADYTTEWQRWLVITRPELTDALATVLANMAKRIVDDCVRIPHLREYPRFTAELTRAALAALGLAAS